MARTVMRGIPYRACLIAVLAASVAAACVTITPVSRVGSALSPAPASVAPTPTSRPTVEPRPSATPTDSAPTLTPAPGESTTPPTHPPTTAQPTEQPTEPADTPNPNDPACRDDAFTLEGFAWTQSFDWYFNSDSTPDRYDADAVLAVVRHAVDNVLSERNDCGRPDRIFAEARYQGTTSLEPCASSGDESNVIGFGPITSDLSADTIAYTCPYTFSNSGEVAEADIVIGAKVDWALTLDDCHFQELLEPTMTHEVGHVFGLGHVTERQHRDLTMSTRSNGWCDDSSSTLGLGDMLALEQLYPEN